MEEAKAKKMDVQRFKAWIEVQGAVCQVNNNRLECVLNIDHIVSGHFAAFYAMPSINGLMVTELSGYFPSEATAWAALQGDENPAHPAKPAVEWMKEQYLTDKNARVEKLII